MSDRPTWMPSEAGLTSIEYHAEDALRLGSHRNTHDAMRAFAYHTGIRAQIAVLEEEDAHMVAYLGEYNDENREWRQSRLAKLRKELKE